MPYTIEKAGTGFRVVNSASGKVHSKHTTRRKAEAQLRLLRGVEHGFKPTGAKPSRVDKVRHLAANGSPRQRREAKLYLKLGGK